MAISEAPELSEVLLEGAEATGEEEGGERWVMDGEDTAVLLRPRCTVVVESVWDVGV